MKRPLRAATDAWFTAYNAGDAKTVADSWTVHGEWINLAGQRFEGHAAIRKELESVLAAAKGLRLELLDCSIRFVTPNVAVEEGRSQATLPGQDASESTFVAICVKHGSDWKLDSLRETPAPASLESTSPLNDLAWLVGEWGDAGGDATISTKVSWTKNKSFLSYSFKVSSPDGNDLEGTQVIGWDPAAGTIRSWMFDSDGGFGGGTWTKKDNRWTIKFEQVLPDGRKASATNIYTIIDHDTITWQSIGREVDGQFMPNIGPLKVVRKAK